MAQATLAILGHMAAVSDPVRCRMLLLLDNGRVMAGQVADVPRVEHAMDALMCLTTVATRLGDRCGLVAFDRQVRAVLPARAGRDQVGRGAVARWI